MNCTEIINIVNNLHNNPIVIIQHYTDLILTPSVFIFLYFYKKYNIKKVATYTFLTSAGIYVPIHTFIALIMYFILKYNILSYL